MNFKVPIERFSMNASEYVFGAESTMAVGVSTGLALGPTRLSTRNAM